MYVEIDIAGATFRLDPLNVRDAAYPYLVGTGTLRMAARAGQSAGLGVGESPSFDVELRNDKRQAVSLIGTPLRSPLRVYDDAGDVFFEGIVSKVNLGRNVSLVIES